MSVPRGQASVRRGCCRASACGRTPRALVGPNDSRSTRRPVAGSSRRQAAVGMRDQPERLLGADARALALARQPAQRAAHEAALAGDAVDQPAGSRRRGRRCCRRAGRSKRSALSRTVGASGTWIVMPERRTAATAAMLASASAPAAASGQCGWRAMGGDESCTVVDLVVKRARQRTAESSGDLRRALVEAGGVGAARGRSATGVAIAARSRSAHQASRSSWPTRATSPTQRSIGSVRRTRHGRTCGQRCR